MIILNSDEDMLTVGIYKITTPSNKIYIGHTRDSFSSRARTHLRRMKSQNHHSKSLSAAWRSYGESITFEIIEIMDSNLCRKDFIKYEQKWWDIYSNKGFHLLNDRPSDNGGIEMSEEIKKKISISLRKNPIIVKLCAFCQKEFSTVKDSRERKFCSNSCSSKVKTKNRKNNPSRKMSENQKELLSISMRNNKNSIGNKGGLKTSHLRWHIRRGVFSEKCILCKESNN